MAICGVWTARALTGRVAAPILNNGLDFGNENRYHLCMSNQMSNKSSQTQEAGTTPQPMRDCPLRISSSRLLGERGELVIEHEGREYRLRLTQNRKLILTA